MSTIYEGPRAWKSDTIQLLVNRGDIAVPFLPLRYFYSISYGPDYELGWHQWDSSVEIKFAEATANRLNKWLAAQKQPAQEEAEDWNTVFDTASLLS